jgi:hypothetical protein
MKNSMNTAKFFVMSASADFRKKYYGKLSKLSKDFMVDNDSIKEIRKLDLKKLEKMLIKDGIPLTLKDEVASHTQDSHTEHYNSDTGHNNSSHTDDRGEITANIDWIKLIDKYGKIKNKTDFTDSIIKRHGISTDSIRHR